jgi:hypothetical protein
VYRRRNRSAVIDGGILIEQAAEYLHSLILGDPLDPSARLATSMRNISTTCMPYVKNSLNGTFFGGEKDFPQSRLNLCWSTRETCQISSPRRSPHMSQHPALPDLQEAISLINHYTGEEPRLAVSFLNYPRQSLSEKIFSIRAHALLIDKPTTTLLPAHSGKRLRWLLTSSDSSILSCHQKCRGII